MKKLSDAQVRQALQTRIQALRPDATARWGRMTVDQMLWHLNAGLSSALGRLESEPAGGPVHHTLVKWAALFGPWPRGKVKTNREMVAREQYDFHAERERLARLMDELAGRDLSGSWPPHPVFGPMTGWQWSRLEFRHIDYHLSQFDA